MSGNHHLYVPGPSNVPAAVQQAIHCPMEDHRNPTIPDSIAPLMEDMKKNSFNRKRKSRFLSFIWYRLLGSCTSKYT